MDDLRVRGMIKSMKIALHSLIFLLIFGCAGKKLIVRNADTLIEYQINKRLPLNDSQEKKLAKDIDSFLNTEKKVAEEIIRIVNKIDLESPDNVGACFKDLEVTYRQVARSFTKLMAKYMAQLDEKQRSVLFDNLKEENKKFQDKTKDELREETQDKLENLIGDFNDEQEKILKGLEDYLFERTQKRIIRRVELHAEFKETLNAQLTESEKEERILKSYIDYEQDNFTESKVYELLLKFRPTLSADQKKTFSGNMDQVKEMLGYYLKATY